MPDFVKNIGDYILRNKLHNAIFSAKTPPFVPITEERQIMNPDNSAAQDINNMSPMASQPVPELSSVSNYRKVLEEPTPRKEDYPASGFRKFLGTLAGVGMGIVRGPERGIALGDQIAHNKYYDAVRDQQTRAADAGEVAKFDLAESDRLRKEGESRARQGHLESQGAAEEARKRAEEARAERQRIEARTFEQDLALKNAGVRPNLQPKEFILEDGKKVVGTFDTKSGEMVANGVILSPDSVKQMHSVGVEPRNPAGMYKQAWETQNPGQVMTPDQVAQIPGKVMPPEVKQGMIARTVGTNLSNADKQFEQSPDNIKLIVDQVKAGRTEVLDTLDPDLRKRAQVELAKQGFTIPARINEAAKNQLDASEQTIGHSAVVRQIANDPELQKFIGPISGRLTEILNGIGTGAIMAPDSVKQKAKELQSRMNILLAQEARVQGGGRTSDQLRKLLGMTAPAFFQNLPLLNGALDAIEGSAKIVRDQIKGRQGGQPINDPNVVKDKNYYLKRLQGGQ